MASEAHAHQPARDTHAADHVVPVGIYIAVFVALLVGTGLTVWVSTLELGVWNTPVALAIAVTKAMLVILFFMHVKYSPRLVWVALGAAFFWLVQMIAGTLADYLSRGLLGSPGT
ncbi:MAG TPA: cytochrome C oxidase subunit IV family protein [Vicinamibacteria bacterium]|jgi:cytochrome c oxidase subunit 4